MPSMDRVSSLWWSYSSPIRWAAAIVLVLLAGISTVMHEESPPTQRATVAADDIASGAIIKATDLTTAVDTLGLATLQLDQVPGEVARGPIPAGEPITASRLVPGRAVAHPPNLVAFPLVLPEVHVVDLLVSGDHIDILASREPLESGEAQLVASDVEVLTVPESDEPGIGSMVLVAASRSQAMALAGIKRAGSISIAIR
jgi:Flp pilus assembly protein CpaB